MPLFQPTSGGGRTIKFITVANAAARLALTSIVAQNGDHVLQTDTGRIYELIDVTDIASEGGWLAMVAAEVATKYRIKPDGTLQLWNSDQNLWFELRISGALGAEFTEIIQPGQS